MSCWLFFSLCIIRVRVVISNCCSRVDKRNPVECSFVVITECVYNTRDWSIILSINILYCTSGSINFPMQAIQAKHYLNEFLWFNNQLVRQQNNRNHVLYIYIAFYNTSLTFHIVVNTYFLLTLGLKLYYPVYKCSCHNIYCYGLGDLGTLI